MVTYPTILGDGGHQDGSFSANVFSNVGLGRCAMLFGGFENELYVRQKIHVDGKVSYLSWGLSLAFGTTLTFTLRQNGANTALAVSFGPDDTGWMTDTTDIVAVSSGDWLDFEADVGSGNSGYSGSFFCASAKFAAATSVQLLATVSDEDANTFSPLAVQYGEFLGILQPGVTNESNAQFYALTDGTWEYLACYVQTNTFGTTATIVNRISVSDGSMSIVVPVAGTGNFQDTTHSDSVIVGDLLDYAISTSATTGTIGIDWIGCHYFATTGAAAISPCMIGGTPNFPGTISDGTTNYSSLFGGGNFASDFDRSMGKFPYAATLTDYANYLTAAEENGAATFTLMLDGLGSGLSISSGLGETGWFIDSSDTIEVGAGATCANRIVGSGHSGTTVTWDGAGLLVIGSAS